MQSQSQSQSQSDPLGVLAMFDAIGKDEKVFEDQEFKLHSKFSSSPKNKRKPAVSPPPSMPALELYDPDEIEEVPETPPPVSSERLDCQSPLVVTEATLLKRRKKTAWDRQRDREVVVVHDSDSESEQEEEDDDEIVRLTQAQSRTDDDDGDAEEEEDGGASGAASPQSSQASASSTGSVPPWGEIKPGSYSPPPAAMVLAALEEEEKGEQEQKVAEKGDDPLSDFHLQDVPYGIKEQLAALPEAEVCNVHHYFLHPLMRDQEVKKEHICRKCKVTTCIYCCEYGAHAGHHTMDQYSWHYAKAMAPCIRIFCLDVGTAYETDVDYAEDSDADFDREYVFTYNRSIPFSRLEKVGEFRIRAGSLEEGLACLFRRDASWFGNHQALDLALHALSPKGLLKAIRKRYLERDGWHWECRMIPRLK